MVDPANLAQLRPGMAVALAPPEGWDDTTPAGHQSRYVIGENGVADWAQAHMLDHIGGVMHPVQARPSTAFSPNYIEFEEELGSFNFGVDGCAQLDLRSMRLDWACG